MSAQTDAAHFLDVLYSGKPDYSLIVVTARKGSGWDRSHFLRAPADALHYVLGGVDVYHRVTPIGARPKRGRGDEADAVALPGAWIDLDVNGTPGAKGDLVTGGFPDLGAAQEVATCVLEPSLLVGSGGGLQAYYLLGEMLPLATDLDRQRAKRLVEGFQRRLRHEAAERFGVRKVDSTHDLARVLRPPGTVNAKAGQRRPVVLLDDGARRYTVAELEAAALPEEPLSGEPSASASVDAEAVLATNPALAKIAARRGPKPGDHSPSAWDFHLACQAARLGYDDGVLAALIRYARKTYGKDQRDREKGERLDYVERTVRAVRERIGYVGPVAPADALLAELTRELRLAEIGRHVVGTEVVGKGRTARAKIRLDDDYVIEFDQFAHVGQPAVLSETLAMTTGLVAVFEKVAAVRISALVRLAASREQEIDERQIYVDEALKLLRLAPGHPFRFDNQASKWEAWTLVDEIDPEAVPDVDVSDAIKPVRRERIRPVAEAVARRMIVPTDTVTGERFVVAGWWQLFARLRLGAGARPEKARATMMASGWKMRAGGTGRIKASDPAGGPPLTLCFYVVERDWEAGAEGQV